MTDSGSTAPHTQSPPEGGGLSRWPNIALAQARSEERIEQLSELSRTLLPTDEGTFVVFGSLARKEFTAGSDLDWAVVIDGRADSNHLEIVHQLSRNLIKAGFKVPGPTGIFGGLVFSHELIHAIGGEEDTNKNMTRRMLLLLESIPIGSEPSISVHSRVLKGVLYRYVVEDASFLSPERRFRVPRFLLNDVVRFWRTMAVDYASKHRERAGKGWALRNIKLRMSRKLLFVSGLFMCISHTVSSGGLTDGSEFPQRVVDNLIAWTARSPLASLSHVVGHFAPDLSTEIFEPYDSFLGILADEDRRGLLESLDTESAYKSDAFVEARNIARRFDAALIKFLFESDSELSDLVKRYGVF